MSKGKLIVLSRDIRKYTTKTLFSHTFVNLFSTILKIDSGVDLAAFGGIGTHTQSTGDASREAVAPAGRNGSLVALVTTS
jgi:hypothetical protein